MKRKRPFIMIAVMAVLISALSSTAFAIDESDVQSAIAASSKAEVAGNIFIWFLCAIGFLKVSQKIDSFMASLGVNVGRTGGSMIGELLLAGRAITTAASTLGGNIFSRSHGGTAHSNSTNNVTHNTSRAAGAGYTGGHGAIGLAQRVVGQAATSGATGKGGGFSGMVGSALFTSSMARGGALANSVISTVAQGDISTVGSITGDEASAALTSYLGYGNIPESASDSAEGHSEPVHQVGGASNDVGGGVVVAPGMTTQNHPVQGTEHVQGSVPQVPKTPVSGADVVSLDGGSAVQAEVQNGFESTPTDPSIGLTGAGIPIGQDAGSHIITEDGAVIASAPADGSKEPTPIPSGSDDYPVGTVPITASVARRAPDSGYGSGSTIQSQPASGPDVSSTPASQPVPTFRNVEIGGGRITGYESIPGETGERQFAMYNADQYMEPSGDFSVVKTVDGASWYKQYAEPVVKKTPHEEAGGKISYEERIVQQMPQIPKRKDRV